MVAMAAKTQSLPTYDGVPVEINDTEMHYDKTMHHVTPVGEAGQSDEGGWVFESDLEGVN